MSRSLWVAYSLLAAAALVLATGCVVDQNYSAAARPTQKFPSTSWAKNEQPVEPEIRWVQVPPQHAVAPSSVSGGPCADDNACPGKELCIRGRCALYDDSVPATPDTALPPTPQQLQDATGPAATAAPLEPAAAPDAPITRMNQEDAYAVIIGIDRYRSSAIPAAQNAENDANAFAKYAARTLGIPDRNIRLLVGSEASKSDIEAVLQEWLPAQPTQPGSNVYFFFSGHGAPDAQTGDTYLVPFDGDPAYLKSKGISLAGLYKHFSALPGRRLLAMIDACFSGAGGRSVLPKGLRPLLAVKMPELESGTVAVLAASGADEVTGPAPSAAHGLFTYHLLRALSGLADRDGDKAITLHELNLFVARHVTEEARRANRQQSPSLKFVGVDKPGDWTVVDHLVE